MVRISLVYIVERIHIAVRQDKECILLSFPQMCELLFSLFTVGHWREFVFHIIDRRKPSHMAASFSFIPGLQRTVTTELLKDTGAFLTVYFLTASMGGVSSGLFKGILSSGGFFGLV